MPLSKKICVVRNGEVMPDQSSEHSSYSNILNGNGSKNGNVNKHDNYVYSMPIVNQLAVEEEDESVDLRQLVRVVKHRLRLISAIAVGITTTVAILTFNQEPKYKGSFQLLVEPVNQEKDVENPLSVLGENIGGLDYDSQIHVLRSPKVLLPIIRQLKKQYPEIEYKELIKAKKSPLKIERIEQTKILEISYTDPNSEKIQFVLDNLAQAYLSYSLEEKRKETKQGIEFVDNQLPRIRNRVDELQAKLQKFRQQHDLLDPEEQATILSEKLVNFEEKYFDTKTELKETQSLYNILQGQLGLQPEQALAASYLSESPRYQNLLDELQA